MNKEVRLLVLHVCLFLLGSIAVILPTAAVGLLGDGGKVFWKAAVQRKHLQEYSKRLLDSSVGAPRYANDRHLKRSLAKHAEDFDAAVIGSSRVMHLSSLRSPSIRKRFGRILNLGASGGTLEDVAASSEMLLDSGFVKAPGKTVIIGLDPWMLRWRMDVRFHEHISQLNAMMHRVGSGKFYGATRYKLKKIRNLFTYNYFWVSLKAIIVGGPGETLGIPDYKTFEYHESILDTGFKYDIILNDGSLLQAALDRKARQTSTNYHHSVSYKITDQIPDRSALKFLSDIVKLFQSFDVNVVLFLCPYHHCLFDEENDSYRSVIENAEDVYREFADDYAVELYGSYRPDYVGAKEDEFFDFMHPRPPVINRIFR
uniref:Uncharacterized protein n=1 Tax=uncultured Verrucomicrobiales bacterium HF0200_39L05 TaxID=710997 RepID=E0XUN4_9BACT|nr:hypothetical protein [uncultured Verrucomicrobiales bacterium HF0200_39L05]